jgi:hypothetical protein
VTPDDVAALLASLHPDYHDYIAAVRYGRTRLRPLSLYAGLVRRGGLDPRDPDDGPRAGRGVSNDLIIYADTYETWRTPAWRRLLVDHEYFHARHLAHGLSAPVVGFGDARADTDYYEALAWGYVLSRDEQGVYGELSARERSEVAARYAEHRDRFHAFVMKEQASAWAHYGRFLPDPYEVTTLASALTAGPGRATDPATR